MSTQQISRHQRLLKGLEEYFKNTPEDEIRESWDKTKEFDSVGPTVDEFLKTIKQRTLKDRIKIDGSWYVREKEKDFEIIQERSLQIYAGESYIFSLKDVFGSDGKYFCKPYLEILILPHLTSKWSWDNSELLLRLLEEDVEDIWGYTVDDDIMIVNHYIEEARALVQKGKDLGWFK